MRRLCHGSSLTSKTARINALAPYGTTGRREARRATGSGRRAKSLELLRDLFPEDFGPKESQEERAQRLRKLKTPPPTPPDPTGHDDGKVRVELSKWDKKGRVVGEQGVLRMTHASTSLVADDFLQLMPHGRHLEGWKSRLGAIQKVIPGRDARTLRRLPFYYLLFESLRSAEVYRERAMRVSEVYDSYGPLAEVTDQPPRRTNLIMPGENILQLANSYTLTPTGRQLQLEVMRQPYKQHLRDILQFQGYEFVQHRAWKSPAEVVIHGGMSALSIKDLRHTVNEAELARNMPWTGNQYEGVRLRHWDTSWLREAGEVPGRDYTALRDRERTENGEGDGETAADQGKPRHLPITPVVAGFQALEDAHAFVRHFHRRVLPRRRQVEFAPPLMLSMEVLW